MSEYERFRNTIQVAIAQIDQDPDEKQLLVLVGSLITTIREYNHQITGLLQLGQAENRSTAELLAEMIQKLGAGSKATASRLDSIRSGTRKYCIG